MRFAPILLLLLLIGGAVLAFNLFGPKDGASIKEKLGGTPATEESAQPAEGEGTETAENAGAPKADALKAVAQRHPEIESIKVEENKAYVHFHKSALPKPAENIQQVLNTLAAEIQALLGNKTLNGLDELVVYQTMPGDNGTSQNFFTYTFDWKRLQKDAPEGELKAWDLLPYLIKPTGPIVGKDYSQQGIDAKNQFCAAEGYEAKVQEDIKASAICH